jgi:uncharacterized protein
MTSPESTLDTAALGGIPDIHFIRGGHHSAMLDVDSGRLFALDAGVGDMIEAAWSAGYADRVRFMLAARGMLSRRIPTPPPDRVPVRSVSLAIAARCNLACSYCYAERGTFGGSDQSMSSEVARQTIENLIADAKPGETVRVVFLGGEPLANRALLREATLHAKTRGEDAGVGVAFSLTTNATLLTEDDAAFLDTHGFAVTVSIDGIGAVHDQLRPSRGGSPTYARVIERARLLLRRPGRRASVHARVSVTPTNLALPVTLEELVRLGFDAVQFSPVLSSPTGRAEMDSHSLEGMLNAMITCGRACEEALAGGVIIPFANFLTTLRRINDHAHDEYPCGAGGSYVGVSADGGMYACHRFVGDAVGRLGDVAKGIDPERQAAWLSSRNLRFQEPCRTCWARHLCGGGCHFEVMRRGRPACDYIRGWLDYCLGAYIRLHATSAATLAMALTSAQRQV